MIAIFIAVFFTTYCLQAEQFGLREKLGFMVISVAISTKQAMQKYLTPKEHAKILGVPPVYSLNFMWINKQRKEEQKTLAPEAINKNLVSNLVGWTGVNPDAQSINLWYDSVMTTPEQLENTKKEISSYQLSYGPAITLKDIRDLQEVKDNPEVFSTKAPVFFRVDLLRVIAAYDTLIHTDKKRPTAFVYADLDVPPVPQKKLFDIVDMANLRRYGIVMAKGNTKSGGYYENSFQMIANKEKALMALQTALIKPCIKYAYKKIAQHVFSKELPYHPLFDTERVWRKYKDTFRYLYVLKRLGTLSIVDNVFEPNKRMPVWWEQKHLMWMPLKEVSMPEREGAYIGRSLPDE